MEEPKILVGIRKRPLSKKEASKGDTDTVAVKNRSTVIVTQYKQKVDLTKYLEETVFNFDFAFNEETQNQQIYDTAVRPLVDSAFKGAKVTCFAYGQTGSGKTFTMNGNQKMGIVGLYALGAQDIFSYLADPSFRHLKAKLSYFEIYCGKLYDLLNKRQELKIREDNKSNINIIGMEQAEISNWNQFNDYLKLGSQQRITSQNSANSESSRSHAILQVILKEGKKVYGKISFIDLAGNQRGADHTDMKKQTRIDGAQINKSLLSLKQCIRALDQGKGHTPFRGSKLTMVLKDSFVGFCRTVMIGNVSPSSASSENTLNTLRYADRVKQLRKPAENLSKEEQKAREMMLPRQNKNAIKIEITNEDDAEDIELKRQQAQRNYGIVEEPSREKSKEPVQQPRARQQSFSGGLRGGRIEPPSNPKPIVQTNPPKGLPQADRKPALTRQTSKDQFGQYSTGVTRANSLQTSSPRGLMRPPNDYEDIDQPTANYQTQKRNNYQPIRTNHGPQLQNNYMPAHTRSNSGAGNLGIQSKNDSQDSNYGLQGNYSGTYENRSNLATDRVNQYKSNYQYQTGPDRQEKATSFKQPNANFATVNNNGNNSNNNYQMKGGYGQARAHFQNLRQQQQRQQIPKDWQGMINIYYSSEDPRFKTQVKMKIHEHLYNEENDLMSNHSTTLRSSLDVIKSEMSLINELQKNRDSVSTREYVSLVQDSIDEKISQLELLRQRLVQFTYKLDNVEQLENDNEGGGGYEPRDDDQLLLDD